LRPFGFSNLFVILAYNGMVAMNAAAVLLPLNGIATDEVSAMYPSAFTPAGYVFSIWSVIYLGLLVYAISQATPRLRSRPAVARIAWPFVLSSALNAVWLYTWHWLMIELSVLVMALLLLSLIVIYVRLRPRGVDPTPAERWAVRLPFSIYLGWISVATIANASGALKATGWDGLGLADPTWAAIMIGVATLLGIVMLARHRDVGFTMVLAWAFVGIAVAQRPEPLLPAVALGAALLLMLVALAFVGPARPARRVGVPSTMVQR